jgi:phosphate-selective porin OprO/OprP
LARVGSLDVDNKAFAGTADRLANPASQASKADSYGVGLNWYLNSNAKITADYNETRFDGGAATGDRRDEKALFTRLTLQY